MPASWFSPCSSRDGCHPATLGQCCDERHLRDALTAKIFWRNEGGRRLGFAGSTHWIVATALLGVTTLSVIAGFVLVNLEEVRSREFQSSGQSG